MSFERSRPGRSKVSVYSLIGLLIFLSPTHADNGDILATVEHCASHAIDLAYDPTMSSLWVADQFSGEVCRFRISSFPPLELEDSIPHPFGPAQLPSVVPRITGIAYQSAHDTLLVLNFSTLEVAEISKSTGAAVAPTFTIDPPQANALVTGLSYDSLSDTLWYYDSFNDEIINCDLSGVTLDTIAAPTSVPGEGLQGRGITFLAKNGESLLEVTHGTILEFSTVRALRLGTDGTPLGVEVDLTQVGGEVLGIERNPSSPSVLYATTETHIMEIDATEPALLPPRGLTCLARVTGSIELNWKNHGPGPDGTYDSITVTRLGQSTVIDGSRESFVDPTPMANGVMTYEVTATSGMLSETSTCIATIGRGALIDYVPFAGSRIQDVALDGNRGWLYATDGLSADGRIYIYDASNLAVVGFFETGQSNLRGVAYNSALDRVAFTRHGSTVLQTLDPNNGVVDSGGFPAGPAGAEIAALAYDRTRDHYLYIDAADEEVVRIEADNSAGAGTVLGECGLAVVIGLTLDQGIDALADGFFYASVTATFSEDHAGVHTFEGNTSVCLPPSPPGTIPLDAIGGSLDVADGVHGIAASENFLYVAGEASNSLFRVLVRPIPSPFVRGDVDGDGTFSGLADALFLLAFAFVPGSPAPPCMEAADADNSGTFNGVADGLHILDAQFIPGSPPIPAPFPNCGPDDDNALGCSIPPANCQ